MKVVENHFSVKKMINILLWISQGILAFMFFWAGYVKVFQSVEQMTEMMAWAPEVPLLFIRFLGICELLGGFGLILPSLLRIKPKLTIWAATGCSVLMLCAIIFHLSRGEVSEIGLNIGLGLMGIFIIWGRATKAPIQAR